MSHHKPILLFTGGLDSVCAWHLLDRPRCLYVELGRSADIPGAQDIPFERHYSPWGAPTAADGHIPLRNLHLASVGALYADRVILGAVKGESSPDKSAKFLRSASRALSAASQGRRIRVEAPLKRYTKRQLVARLIRLLGRDQAEVLIARTSSCYQPPACGQCMACFRRWVALSLNDIHEHFQQPPWEREFESNPLHYLRNAPLREWPGIALTNYEALTAMRRAAPRSAP